MAGDICRFLDEQGIDEATLVGHSLGGRTAMATALVHGDRVRLCSRSLPPVLVTECPLTLLLYTVALCDVILMGQYRCIVGWW